MRPTEQNLSYRAKDQRGHAAICEMPEPTSEALDDEGVFGRIDRGDREAVAALQDAHVGKFGITANFRQRHQPRLLQQPYVDVEPARRLRRRLGVEVLVLGVDRKS